MSKSFANAGLALCLITSVALADEGEVFVPEPVAASAARAELKPTRGSQVTGSVRFTAAEGGVHVNAEVTGLTPGKHGFHVHERGDCSDPEGKSAGGHFNPEGHSHGSPASEAHHAGDFGNLIADETGVAKLDAHFHGLSLSGANSIIGRGLIVHAEEDDLSTQPTGNAGARQACAVIEAATAP